MIPEAAVTAATKVRHAVIRQRLFAAIDRRLARRYAPHIQCPDCGEHIPVEHKISIETREDGGQELMSEPSVDALWGHWATHLGLNEPTP
jgi:hypothetical protein